VLSRVDGKVVMVLIEAKGIGSFDTEQFGKKIERLRAMKSPWIDSNGSRKPIEWLTPIMLLMSPKKPSKDTCTAFCEQLASLSDDYGRIRFWPIARSADPSLLWLKLKAFGDYHGEKSKFLRVTTCYENGSRAKNKSDRTENSYKHWRVEPRGFLET
jgi:hypothetical protein